MLPPKPKEGTAVHSSTSVAASSVRVCVARCWLLGNVVYEELLALPTNAVPPAAGASAPASNPRRPRLADLLPMLDDRAQALRVYANADRLTDSRKLARSEQNRAWLRCCLLACPNY